MENFIVRIYRRDDHQGAVAGIVEVVDAQEQKPFKTQAELLSILKIGEHDHDPLPESQNSLYAPLDVIPE